ncbi:MAG: zinc-binding alcohol dehydrogenase [Proteobacteria bacterium]|nr:zinc-binding alcohol dehydrogenase [Pseudomonadota bacterium]
MTTDNSRAYWATAAGQGELRAAPLPGRESGEVLVRTLHSGISRGTEVLVLGGRVPVSQYAVMRAPFQEGDFPFPVKYGYASVGVVADGPAALAGQSVFCLYPHQDRYVVPADAVVPLPDGLPPGRAVLGANMETALNGVWDLAPGPGDRVAVIGAGTVGCLVAWLMGRIPGCQVELIDTDPGKALIAESLGVAFATPQTARGEADAVVHVSGNPAGLRTALGLAGFEATVLEMSWFGDQAVSLPLGEAFHSRRLILKSSQVGHVAAARRGRWSRRRRLQAALDLLRDDRLDVLMSGSSPFAELPAVMARLAAEPGGVLCHRIDYA